MLIMLGLYQNNNWLIIKLGQAINNKVIFIASTNIDKSNKTCNKQDLPDYWWSPPFARVNRISL